MVRLTLTESRSLQQRICVLLLSSLALQIALACAAGVVLYYVPPAERLDIAVPMFLCSGTVPVVVALWSAAYFYFVRLLKTLRAKESV